MGDKYAAGHHKNQGALEGPWFAQLTVVNVHGHFEAEASVVVSWGFPFHDFYSSLE